MYHFTEITPFGTVTYGVRIDFTGGDPSRTIFFGVGAAVGGNGGEPGPITRTKEVPYLLSNNQLNLIGYWKSQLLDPYDYTNVAARFVLPHRRVSFVSSAIQLGAGTLEYTPPGTMVIIDHGGGDAQMVGRGLNPPAKDKAIGQNGFALDDLNRFGTALKGKITKLLLLGCSVATGIDDADNWMNKLSGLLSNDSISAEVMGYNGGVAAIIDDEGKHLGHFEVAVTTNLRVSRGGEPVPLD